VESELALTGDCFVSVFDGGVRLREGHLLLSVHHPQHWCQRPVLLRLADQRPATTATAGGYVAGLARNPPEVVSDREGDTGFRTRLAFLVREDAPGAHVDLALGRERTERLRITLDRTSDRLSVEVTS